VSTRIFTRAKCRRICEEAFAYAAKHGYSNVTVCEKPNVIRETSGMMEAEARRCTRRYPDIQLWDTNIDAQMMWLTKNPEDYGVIVAGNMFGDIISTASPAWSAASASPPRPTSARGRGLRADPRLGAEVRELDPPIVNPIAMILSAVMMLDWLGETGKAERVRAAVAAVVAEGKVRSYDMLKLPGRPAGHRQGAATTTQMTDAISTPRARGSIERPAQRIVAAVVVCTCPATSRSSCSTPGSTGPTVVILDLEDSVHPDEKAPRAGCWCAMRCARSTSAVPSGWCASTSCRSARPTSRHRARVARPRADPEGGDADAGDRGRRAHHPILRELGRTRRRCGSCRSSSRRSASRTRSRSRARRSAWWR
jgi:hypothetical protein